MRMKLSPQAAQVLIAASCNPSWTMTMLANCYSTLGRTGLEAVYEAQASGRLHRDPKTKEWKVTERVPWKRMACVGYLCACNQALIPYVGTDIERDDPLWEDARGVTHGWDDCDTWDVLRARKERNRQ